MAKLKRTIFFWTLVVLFLIITPIIVMRAKGYRFDLSRGVFVHSGIITLKTNPQDFNVYVDEKLEDSKKLNRINSSYNISGLIPKNYNLTISAEGFQSWTKKAEVHSGLSSEFWNVLLVRNDYERTPYNTGGINKFFLSPKNKSLAYVYSNDNETTIKVVNIDTKAIENTFTFSSWQFTDDSRKENVEWSPEGDLLSIPLKKKAAGQGENKIEYDYFIADPSTDEAISLNEFSGKSNIKNVRWDPEEKYYLFFLSENSLYRANIQDKTSAILIAENISSYDLSKTNVYYAQIPNELIFKTSLDGKAERTQITQNYPTEQISPTEKLIVYDELRIAFLNKNKELFVFNRGEFDTYFKKLGGDIEGLQFSDDGKKLLFWTNNEITAYFLRQWNVQPTRNENEVQNITRYSESIKNIQWFSDYEHIIFSVGPYIKIIELDSRDHLNCMDIAKADTDSPFIIYNNYLGYLFFTDTKDGASDLNRITLPEPGGFLGLFPPAQQ